MLESNDEEVEKALISGLYRQHKVFWYDWGMSYDKSVPSLRETCGVCGDWMTSVHPWYSAVPNSNELLMPGECSGEASFAVVLSSKSLAVIQEAYARSESAGGRHDADSETSPGKVGD